MRLNVGILFILIQIALPIFCAEDSSNESGIHITWDYENGSLGDWHINSANEIVLSHAPGSGNLWYFFRLDGVLNQTITFVFEKARSDLFGENNLPVVSYDQKHWFYITDRFILPISEDPQHVRFSFTHTFAQNRAWIAYTPPFTNTMLDQILETYAEHPHLKIETICETPIEHLPIPLLEITDPDVKQTAKKTIFLLCREESYETAGSYIGLGILRFLLSDDPIAAALKRRCFFLLIPIFDRDGVALGRAIHPLSRDEGDVYWTETWPETTYSFYEQRQLKLFLQQWKDSGRSIDFAFRFHSDAWKADLFRPEFCSEENRSAQTTLFTDHIVQNFLPWYQIVERTLQETRLTKFVWDLFPEAITASGIHEYLFPRTPERIFSLYKTTDDLLMEGELLVRAIGAFLGVTASDPSPILHGARFYQASAVSSGMLPVQCMYRDSRNRPPEYVRVVMNEKSFELHPLHSGTEQYEQGVIYTGFVPVPNGKNSHFFITANGAKTFRVPAQENRPGPYVAGAAAE